MIKINNIKAGPSTLLNQKTIGIVNWCLLKAIVVNTSKVTEASNLVLIITKEYYFAALKILRSYQAKLSNPVNHNVNKKLD